jgi:hypothetical protein
VDGLPASRPVHWRGGGPHITITADQAELAAARTRQADPTRRRRGPRDPTQVQRKLAHLVRRRHGGRRVRVRGLAKVAADFSLLAAAVNSARLGVLACTGPIAWLGGSMTRPARPPGQPRHSATSSSSTPIWQADTACSHRHQAACPTAPQP